MGYTVRCEAHQTAAFATLLVIHKKALMQLVEDFPQIVQVWRSIAERRERHYASISKTFRFLGHGRSYQDLAASTIQRYWRGRRDQHCNGELLRGVSDLLIGSAAVTEMDADTSVLRNHSRCSIASQHKVKE